MASTQVKIGLDSAVSAQLMCLHSCNMASKDIPCSSRQKTTKAALSSASPMKTVAFFRVELPRGQILSAPPLSNQMHLMKGPPHCIPNIAFILVMLWGKFT